MKVPSEAELVEAITEAARAAISDLFCEYPDDHFYYVSLITTGEGHAPELTAWSKEALASAAKKSDHEAEALLELKWSYADSPFYGHGDHYFEGVRHLFDARPKPDPESAQEWNQEYSLRLRAMEAAMARLDAAGLWGRGDDRIGIVINVEVMPADHTNVERALRLNPTDALKDWLEEAAEPA